MDLLCWAGAVVFPRDQAAGPSPRSAGGDSGADHAHCTGSTALVSSAPHAALVRALPCAHDHTDAVCAGLWVIREQQQPARCHTPDNRQRGGRNPLQTGGPPKTGRQPATHAPLHEQATTRPHASRSAQQQHAHRTTPPTSAGHPANTTPHVQHPQPRPSPTRAHRASW